MATFTVRVTETNWTEYNVEAPSWEAAEDAVRYASEAQLAEWRTDEDGHETYDVDEQDAGDGSSDAEGSAD